MATYPEFLWANHAPSSVPSVPRTTLTVSKKNADLLANRPPLDARRGKTFVDVGETKPREGETSVDVRETKPRERGAFVDVRDVDRLREALRTEPRLRQIKARECRKVGPIFACLVRVPTSWIDYCAMSDDRTSMLENFANWTSDQDLQWWPFGFLRPETHERIGNRRVLALAVLYGVFAGLVMNLVARLTGAEGVPPWVFPLTGTVGFFVMFRTTFALYWNRRAERLEPRSE